MIICAKSGWPVKGHRLVNSGQEKRTLYFTSGWGLATDSKIAAFGLAGRDVFAPNCFNLLYLFILPL